MSLPTPYYEEPGITIYQADCREILPELCGIDLILTSPPYNKGVNSDGRELGPDERVGHYKKNGRMNERGGHGLWMRNALSAGYGEHDDALPWAKYCEQQRDVLKQCWHVLSETGAIYYNHKPRVFNLDLWTPMELNPGLPLRQIVIWARNSGFNFSPTYYTPTHEWILIFAKSGFRLVEGTDRPDVWHIPPELNTPHPAPFPLRLAKRAIETSGARMILDPYMGSGTTLRAAKDLGRTAIGIDINEAYCEIAAQRMAQEVLSFEETA